MRKDIWWKNTNMPLAFTEGHLGKWRRMTEIYLPPTQGLSGAKLISEGKSLTSRLCPTENTSNVDYSF